MDISKLIIAKLDRIEEQVLTTKKRLDKRGEETTNKPMIHNQGRREQLGAINSLRS